jgi:hypothetical protein
MSQESCGLTGLGLGDYVIQLLLVSSAKQADKQQSSGAELVDRAFSNRRRSLAPNYAERSPLNMTF